MGKEEGDAATVTQALIVRSLECLNFIMVASVPLAPVNIGVEQPTVVNFPLLPLFLAANKREFSFAACLGNQ